MIIGQNDYFFAMYFFTFIRHRQNLHNPVLARFYYSLIISL